MSIKLKNSGYYISKNTADEVYASSAVFLIIPIFDLKTYVSLYMGFQELGKR